MRTRILTAAMISMAVSLLISPLAQAETQIPGSEEWEFTVIPYIWMAGIEGDVGVRGVTAGVDVGFSDILDNLDIAGMFDLEAKKGKWAFFINPSYLEITDEESAASSRGITLDAEVTMKAWIVEGGAFYRISEHAVGDDEVRAIAFDLMGGFRYNYLKTEVDLEGPGGGLDGEESKDWFDPIVGGRVQARLSERLLLNLRGDVGGFGISGASNSTWNLIAVLGYELNERTTILAGYRALGIDYDDGSGADLFEYDVTMSGPMVGLAIQF